MSVVFVCRFVVLLVTVQFTRNNFDEVRDFTNGTAHGFFFFAYDPEGTATCFIPTPEGLFTATAGDFIIKGVKGEFYPCKPDIFAATYELTE